MITFITGNRKCNRVDEENKGFDGSVWIQPPNKNNQLFQQMKWISFKSSNTSAGGLCIYLLSDQNYTWSNTDCGNIKGVICETHKFLSQNKTFNDEIYINKDGCRGKNIKEKGIFVAITRFC